MYLQEVYKGYSPWGGIQQSNVIKRGLKFVCTAGHGGYMITENFAEKYLSDACKKQAEQYGKYLCYEEDCMYALVELDLLLNNPEILTKQLLERDIIIANYKNSLIESVSLYTPQYLLEVGIEPCKKQYDIFLQREKEDIMRKERHPDLIVSASSITNTETLVWTADNVKHIVNADSYKKLRESGNILFLSNCIIMEGI